MRMSNDLNRSQLIMYQLKKFLLGVLFQSLTSYLGLIKSSQSFQKIAQIRTNAIEVLK